ncbi:FMN-binding negative transcriptional regulator [Pseudomonas sp.]|uniref:FMN-binding negative transcriptional regulator n=1 Tax=Pseudomonas sp. TaxID=306 RepID=UPI0028ADAA9C|nr:FMN-binding negative transcriptional regulator [Pseudomonas sp.]
MSQCPFHYTDYRCIDPGAINRFIDAFPLALITSTADGRFCSSHIPLLRNPDGSLFGHVDRRNPQFEARTALEAQLVFMGPSSYVPPEGYRHRQLPTWNYLAVHMHARIQVIDQAPETLAILERTAACLAHHGSTYRVDPHDPRVVANLPHILGLAIEPLQVEGRFKLSQDKREEDRDAALDWFIDAQGRDLRALLEHLKSFAKAHPTA